MPLPTPPQVTEPAAPAVREVREALQSLANALADRRLSWEAAFALYDPNRTGVVSESSLDLPKYPHTPA